jgi:hypothetical protein
VYKSVQISYFSHLLTFRIPTFDQLLQYSTAFADPNLEENQAEMKKLAQYLNNESLQFPVSAILNFY